MRKYVKKFKWVKKPMNFSINFKNSRHVITSHTIKFHMYGFFSKTVLTIYSQNIHIIFCHLILLKYLDLIKYRNLARFHRPLFSSWICFNAKCVTKKQSQCAHLLLGICIFLETVTESFVNILWEAPFACRDLPGVHYLLFSSLDIP